MIDSIQRVWTNIVAQSNHFLFWFRPFSVSPLMTPTGVFFILGRKPNRAESRFGRRNVRAVTAFFRTIVPRFDPIPINGSPFFVRSYRHRLYVYP